MTERRRFNSRERTALYLAADGRCTECGRELEPGWHGDHETPWSRGGKTDVINGQALCPPCNLKKGNNMSTDLRAWQSRALAELGAWNPRPDLGYLVEATPGAGKTRLAIEAARRLLETGRIQRVLVAVPTARLEAQWSEEFAKFGIQIMPDWHASTGTLPSDEHGCAATYAEIANSAQSFRRLCNVPTLAILDEVHHCGDERSWGNAIRTAFEPSVVKLLLSGTPFRSDNNAIPFVNYVDGTGAPDFRYGYRDALTDGVVRAVFFPRRGGRTEWTDGERVESHTFDEKLKDRDANRRLRTAISVKGEWLPSVLGDANGQLIELRQTDPLAGGIVFCEDSDSARAVHQMLGDASVLAITDEPRSDDIIKQFRDSTTPWIVSIRKVSEGVDIPRLRVGVYVTNWITEMFFRQVVGRLVRTRPDEEDPTSYLFIPDDERLRAMAEEIKIARDHVLNAQAERLAGEGELPFEDRGSLFIPISATAEDRGIIADSDTITPAQLAEAERIKRLSPDTAALPSITVALLLRNAGQLGEPATEATEQAGDDGRTTDQHAHKASLRKANSQRVAQIAKAYGVEYAIVNNRLNAAVGVRKVAQCTVEQFQQRLKLANDWLASGVWHD